MTDINYTLIRTPRRRTIGIRVSSDNIITVHAPLKISESRICEIVRSKSAWIRKRISIHEARNARLKPKQYKEGEEFLYQGELCRMEILWDSTGISLHEGRLLIGVPSGLDGQERSYIGRRLEEWYIRQAAQIFRDRVGFYQDALGLKANLIRVKTLRSRWGSCSIRGNLSFNWLLVMAPPGIIDYMVVHELAHCIHRNHSPAYWKLVESILPDYKTRKKWLRVNSFTLTL
ncbi:MAG: SprT family zinc-dependent metalloprotease [Candidatus Latescibacter sp.]|nr:SprT family zinc-dependent metalloprotease [Candidatus Latescibacter sp.]